MSDTIGFSLNSPPKEAVDYLKGKGYAISFDYDELMHSAHHTSFTVAKVMQLDLLADIHQSLLQAQAKGTPFEQWKKDLIPTLKAKQWWGEKEIYDERTGEYKTIRIDGNRLKTIFVTNINTAYEVGRCRQMEKLPPSFAYLRYWAIKDAKSRPKHAALHGLILPKSDPWWDINRPKNGWRCRCTVQALTKAMIDAKGYKIADKAPPRIADADWGFNPCKDSATMLNKAYLDKVKAIDCPEGNARKRTTECGFMNKAQQELRNTFAKLAALSYAQNKAMPTPRNTVLPLSQANTETDFMKAFMAQFDSSVFTAITLDQLAIDSALFTTHKGDWKWDKNGRAQWLNYMVLNIKEPDEIWRYVDHGIEYLVVISRFSGKNNLQVIAKFERDEGSGAVFTGVTTFATPRKNDYLETERDIKNKELVFRRAS
jgi:SPP1 gp7 family putative phage head morphogenesis protein